MLSNSSKHRLITLAKKAIANRHQYGIQKGVASKFIKFAESWGVKFSTYSRREMEDIFNRQVDAHRIGKGPMAFGFFECEGFYCYVTEVVKILGYYFNGGSVEYDIPNQKLAARINMSRKHLCNVLLKKIGFDFHDSHMYNMGFVRGKQLVCIDFGDE